MIVEGTIITSIIGAVAIVIAGIIKFERKQPMNTGNGFVSKVDCRDWRSDIKNELSCLGSDMKSVEQDVKKLLIHFKLD